MTAIKAKATMNIIKQKISELATGIFALKLLLSEENEFSGCGAM
ncbi:MAG: hypothetical protein QMB62_05140 [Oscillospiraceae bacterium]